MPMPAINDTIVAVSTGWQPMPVGIVRLSGPDSFGLVSHLGVAPSAAPTVERPVWTTGRLQLDTDNSLPATVFWFRAPRSYTGQDVAELHTVGCLPLLRELSARLVELGARRALPGEFTARAFIAGRLDARQVEGVLALMQSKHEADIRQAARLARGSQHSLIADAIERITQLLTLIEAGIDFVEEEDIRFVAPAEIVRTIDGLLEDLAGSHDHAVAGSRAGCPHLALVGLPNAGKSTLFNALVGYERALVSPVLGTTRDVLSAEVDLNDVPVVLQDCAGLGASVDELELATHLATERTAQQADLVLWVHAADTAWDERETVVCSRIPPERRVLVRSKADLSGSRPPGDAPVPFVNAVEVSAVDGSGIGRLRATVGARLEELALPGADSRRGGELRAAVAALGRARGIAATSFSELQFPELVSLELRVARDLLGDETHGTLEEELLGRIFTRFCVGK